MRIYSWDEETNVAHIEKHRVKRSEAEYVVDHAQSPYPEFVGDGKWRVIGKTSAGRWLQVIFFYPDDSEVDPDSLSYLDLESFSNGAAQVVRVIHARDLESPEKRRARKRKRGK
jgi:uncharacterized DUF497 family protein